MEPIDLHPIYLRSSVERSQQISQLQNYSNIAAEISAQQINERIRREQSSPTTIQKTEQSATRSATEGKSKGEYFQYSQSGKKHKGKNIVEQESSHILDVRL